MDFIKDLFGFLWQRKAWWITPIVLVLLVIGAILMLGESSAIGGFIYTLW